MDEESKHFELKKFNKFKKLRLGSKILWYLQILTKNRSERHPLTTTIFNEMKYTLAVEKNIEWIIEYSKTWVYRG